MPNPFKGARVKREWIEARGVWRVTTWYPDKRRKQRNFTDEKDAKGYEYLRQKELRAIAAVTFEQAIDLYESERLKEIDHDRKERVVTETSRRLRAYFAPILGSALGVLTDKKAKELYTGRMEGVTLVEHGLTNRPKLRRAKDETPAPCRLKCKCPGDGPPLEADSHRTYLSEAKTFMKWAVQKEFTGSNPVESVEGTGRRNPGGVGRNRLSRTELRALYVHCMAGAEAGDERCIGILFALLFGFRATEIVTRRVRDVDQVTWTIAVDVDAAKTDASIRDNLIPGPLRAPLAARMLNRLPGDFILGGGRTAHYRDWVSESLRQICPTAGVRIVNAHSLRGAHEDLAKTAGHTSEAICAQLGHEEARTGDRSYTSEMGRKGARRATQATVLGVLEGGLSSRPTGTDSED